MSELKLWKSHFFAKDFSAHASQLSEINLGTVSGPEVSGLLSVLEAEDPEIDWNVDSANSDRPFNFVGAEVIYNGENNPDLPTNGRFTHVLRIDFDPSELPPIGVINFHYNA